MIDEKTSSSILLSRGILNLTHWKSHEYPQLLIKNQIYKFEYFKRFLKEKTLFLLKY
jgi:hypothetical protein